MIYRELPFLGGGAEKAPERFFAKVGIQPGTICIYWKCSYSWYTPGYYPGEGNPKLEPKS